MQISIVYFLFNFFLIYLSTAKKEVPFSLEQLLERNPELIRLIEKRLGDDGFEVDDAVTGGLKNTPATNVNNVNNNQPKLNDDGAVSEPHHSCGVPVYRNSSIIRSKESLANGAVFMLKKINLSPDQCRNLCCNTTKCNLALYQNKEDHNCYLFNCGSPSKCKFSKNDGYVAYDFGASFITSHEDELDKLEKLQPEQKTPLPIPPTLAPTTKTPKELGLYGPCYWGDRCSVQNSECIRGQCRCREGYFEKNHVCVVVTGCGPKQFECKIKGEDMCLQDTKLCDGVNDCDSGIDEQDCPSAGSHMRNDKKPVISGSVPKKNKVVQQIPVTPKAPDFPKTATPSVLVNTPPQKTPGLPKTEKPPVPQTEQVNTVTLTNITKQTEIKQQQQQQHTAENKINKTEKSNGTSTEVKTKVPEKGDNTLSRVESNGKVIVASITNDSQGPIVALSLGLAITLMLLIFVGCRLRTVKKRIRRGKALHSNEADYLINGMYL